MGQVIHALSRIIKVTPTLDTSQYASGDRLGSLMTLSNAVHNTCGYAILQSLHVVDQAGQSQAIDFHFFNGDSVTPAGAPTIASSDNAAIDVSDAVMIAASLGSVSVLAGDYKTFAGNSNATRNDLGLLLCSSDKSRELYCQMILRSGTPTYAASSLVIRFGFLQD